MTPIVSILLPLYNAEKFPAETMESILAQTYQDFELIIINDGSTDQSAKIVSNYHDQRIVYMENDSNMGIVATLNRGLKHTRGKYITRIDSDAFLY